MQSERELKEGFYFIHGFYMRDHSNVRVGEIFRNQMILLKDSMESIYDIDAYDINLIEMQVEDPPPQGAFVYYHGHKFQTAENDPTSIMYTELNRQLIRMIGYESYGNQPEEITDNGSDVCSYHINVGHGNCSIIVFRDHEKYNMWMIDCSVFDFTNKHHYHSNLDACMKEIQEKFDLNRISKLLVTHLHYDHINGIEHLIKMGWIDGDTEVWMNTQYPWKQPAYCRILLQLKALGVKFIDPIVSNSTQHIHILYPHISFNAKHMPPNKNINNASVLYQIFLAGKSMLFTGDIETEGWENVTACYPHLNHSTYYCISHHGSITGHLRNNCVVPHNPISTLADCGNSTELQILMGRNGAYKGIFSKKVTSGFHHLLKTENAEHYISIQWKSGSYSSK